jgi:hypothetical protein
MSGHGENLALGPVRANSWPDRILPNPGGIRYPSGDTRLPYTINQGVT